MRRQDFGKNLRLRAFKQQLTAFSHYLLLRSSPSYVLPGVLATPLKYDVLKVTFILPNKIQKIIFINFKLPILSE